jgi:two-component system sensor histidine kinase VicK
VSCMVVEGMIQVSVKDQGIGISAKDIERLFERYYRVENNNSISGFGIGLYLSAEIIARHNGKIWVESQPNQGATFYFALPF